MSPVLRLAPRSCSVPVNFRNCLHLLCVQCYHRLQHLLCVQCYHRLQHPPFTTPTLCAVLPPFTTPTLCAVLPPFTTCVCVGLGPLTHITCVNCNYNAAYKCCEYDFYCRMLTVWPLLAVRPTLGCALIYGVTDVFVVCDGLP